MSYNFQTRNSVREQVRELAEAMRVWNEKPSYTEPERKALRDRIAFFNHTTKINSFLCAGVKGGGDFPAVSYSNSYVYAALAYATIYKPDAVSGLRENSPAPQSIFQFAFLKEDEAHWADHIDSFFSSLVGESITEIIDQSDYRQLKASESRKAVSVEVLRRNLIRPQAGDAGNWGIQLKTTAEFGLVLNLIRNYQDVSYILVDGTLSLPLVSNPDTSLFYEHLKRLCCIEAGKRKIGIISLTPHHGISGIEILEELAREKLGLSSGDKAEHWYIRFPVPQNDHWTTPLSQTRRIPPPGAVTYILRFHHTTQIMRVDIDRKYWLDFIRSTTEAKTKANEQHLFENLDYLTHDQRCFGYPYPLKSAQNRASLTKAERKTIRKMIIDAAVEAGMKRSLFRENSYSKEIV
jgi:hypothetical protein